MNTSVSSDGSAPSPSTTRVVLTSSMRDALRVEQHRMGMAAKSIGEALAKQQSSITWTVINRWRAKKPDGGWAVSTCDSRQFAIVMTFLRDQTDLFRLDRNGRRRQLIRAIKRSGKGPTAIREGLGREVSDLSAGMIETEDGSRHLGYVNLPEGALRCRNVVLDAAARSI